MKSRTSVFSIFHECEAIVGILMCREGKARLLSPSASCSLEELPASTRRNEFGEPVRIVIALPDKHLREFEQRARRLRQ